jgi:zinc/manganese transport system substrate-binding protein
MQPPSQSFSSRFNGAWFILFVLATCGLSAAPLRIVTLNSVLAEFASSIGGPDATVECLIPGGSDPHGFSPSPADLKRLFQADLVIASGFGMEPWLDKLVSAKGLQGALLDVSTAVQNPVCSVEEEQAAQSRTHASDLPSPVESQAVGVHHEHGERDPHWWHSVSASRDVCRAILQRCAESDASHRAAFQSRWEQLDARLAALEGWVQSEVSKLPVSRRHLVTSHDAFGYFARDFQFQVHPLTGVNPEAEPDARALVGLIQFIRREQIRSVFADNTENPRLLAAMLKESGATLGGTLYADGPGAPASPASTYEAMIRHNTRTIIEALLPLR